MRHMIHAAEYDANKPIATHTQKSFKHVLERLDGSKRLIIDAGCGTGTSTCKIAALNPDCFVVGIDRSESRLRRRRVVPENAMLVRAELADFWRLLAFEGVIVEHTLLLYPNPYPKRAQLRRRWYAHPALPWLLATAGKGLTVRATWRTYLDEFAYAVDAALSAFNPDDGLARPVIVRDAFDNLRRFYNTGPVLVRHLTKIAGDDALTNFEAKYIQTHTPVYDLVLGTPFLPAPPAYTLSSYSNASPLVSNHEEA